MIVDNGRSRLLADPDLREALYCIRCGACLNTCPVYRKVGGHSYGWVYPGPIGAVVSPVLVGLERSKDLPNASSLCGACRDVCPIKINIPHMLLKLRSQLSEGSDSSPTKASLPDRLMSKGYSPLMSSPRLLGFTRTLGLLAQWPFSRGSSSVGCRCRLSPAGHAPGIYPRCRKRASARYGRNGWKGKKSEGGSGDATGKVYSIGQRSAGTEGRPAGTSLRPLAGGTDLRGRAGTGDAREAVCESPGQR